MSTPEDDIKSINASLKDVGDQLKAHAERAAKDANLRAEDRKQVDDLLLKQGELQANLQQMQQVVAKLESNGAGGDVQHQSLGNQFVADEKVKAFLGQTSPRGRADITVKAAITSATTGEGNGGILVEPNRLPGILSLPQRRMTIRDLITPGTTGSPAIEYVKEIGFTNNAAPVAEGAKKPESNIQFEVVTTAARVIAHTMKASRQILSDAPQLASVIDGRLLYGLAYKEEQQLLSGDGLGQSLLGIIPQASSFTAPFDPGDATIIDTIRLAFLQAELAEFPSTGVVLHPTDWARIELLKDELGRYIIGNPQGILGPTLWNRPVVATQAITAGKFLAGAFSLGAQIFDMWQARVEVATENEDDFVKNMVTILAEERLALAVYRPEAFIYGDAITTP